MDFLSSAQGLCGMNEEGLELCEGNTVGSKGGDTEAPYGTQSLCSP